MGLNNESGEFFAVKQVSLIKDEGLKGRVTSHIKALEAEVAVLSQLRWEGREREGREAQLRGGEEGRPKRGRFE
jgi:hypothetical protein